MGFVGPRPELPKIVHTYTPSQKKILEYKPGLFGISQLVLREGVNYKLKLAIENNYYPHKNFTRDMLILLLTPLVLADHTFTRIIPFIKHRREYTDTGWFRYLMSSNGGVLEEGHFETDEIENRKEEEIHAPMARQ